MTITQIALFRASSGGPENVIEDALKVEDTASSQDGVVGLQTKDRNIIQFASKTESLNDNPIFRNLRASCGDPTVTYRLQLNNSALSTDTPATAPVLEVVLNLFPVSRITPEFQKQVESDFAEFDAICKTMAKGDIGLAYGWSIDETEHADVVSEKTRPFLILRGWRSMQDFENLTKQEKFQQEAIPKLLAWKAPFKMWHVDRKA